MILAKKTLGSAGVVDDGKKDKPRKNSRGGGQGWASTPDRRKKYDTVSRNSAVKLMLEYREKISKRINL